MAELLAKLALCIERGKVDRESPYPEDLQGEDGAAELTRRALEVSLSPGEILDQALVAGMNRIGSRFSAGEVYIPDLLFAAKAMNAAMEHLKPYFESGEAVHRGTAIVGTVAGDLHDIGKNIVRMVLEGGGWKVIDLGVDAGTELADFIGRVQRFAFEIETRSGELLDLLSKKGER